MTQQSVEIAVIECAERMAVGCSDYVEQHAYRAADLVFRRGPV